MLKIYIARHGQNMDNAAGILNGHRDLPLTDLGITQAHELAKSIVDAGFTFDTVYASPLSRAYTTAEIVCETMHLPKPVVLAELIERDFGIMTGKHVTDIEEICGADIVKTNIITYFLTPEGAETFPTLLIRAKNALSIIQQTHTHGSILLVTHGDIGKMLYASYYGMAWMDALTKFHFGNAELLLLSPVSGAQDFHVLKFEQHNH